MMTRLLMASILGLSIHNQMPATYTMYFQGQILLVQLYTEEKLTTFNLGVQLEYTMEILTSDDGGQFCGVHPRFCNYNWIQALRT